MRHFLIIALVLAGLAGCMTTGTQDTSHMGEFFASSGRTGEVAPFEDGFIQSVKDPSQDIVIIYNHGTSWGGQFQDCLPGSMPQFLRSWTSNGLGGHDVVVFYLCSQVVEKRFVMGRQRAEENEALLDRLAALGVSPEHIFIVGHSGGASSALLTAERAPEKFNAAIVSAPGYGYAWMDAQGDSYLWMDVEYDKWRHRLASADEMQALVYVFDGDIISPPKDALFLRDHPGVEVIEIPPIDETGALCTDDEEPHFYWWTSCFRNEHQHKVEDYIVGRLTRS